MENNIKVGLVKENGKHYKWRLEDIYETEQLWLDDCVRVKQMADKVLKFRGELSISATMLLNALQLKDKTMEITDKLYMYSLKRSQGNSKNSSNQIIFQKGKLLKSDIVEKLSYFEPELLTISDEILIQFKKEVVQLSLYNFYFDKLTRQKHHILSEDKENLLN